MEIPEGHPLRMEICTGRMLWMLSTLSKLNTIVLLPHCLTYVILSLPVLWLFHWSAAAIACNRPVIDSSDDHTTMTARSPFSFVSTLILSLLTPHWLALPLICCLLVFCNTLLSDNPQFRVRNPHNPHASNCPHSPSH
jgi:uncharacterized membrane protein